MGVFESPQCQKHGFGSKSVLGYLGWGCSKCAMPKKWGFGPALQARICAVSVGCIVALCCLLSEQAQAQAHGTIAFVGAGII